VHTGEVSEKRPTGQAIHDSLLLAEKYPEGHVIQLVDEEIGWYFPLGHFKASVNAVVCA
jgi:hypothetical protein